MRVQPQPHPGWPWCSPRRRGGGRSAPHNTALAPRRGHRHSCRRASGLGGAQKGQKGGNPTARALPAVTAPAGMSQVLRPPQNPRGWGIGDGCMRLARFGEHQEGTPKAAHVLRMARPRPWGHLGAYPMGFRQGMEFGGGRWGGDDSPLPHPGVAPAPCPQDQALHQATGATQSPVMGKEGRWWG